MEHILKSWGNFLRFILGLLFLFLIIISVINRLSENTVFHVDNNNNKTLITIIDKKNVIANSVLPACDCWANTGIEIRPDESYELKVSGKIHTSADRLIKDAEDDTIPRFSWIGPDGDQNFMIRNDVQFKKSDSLRKTLLLTRKARLGQVVLYIQKTSAKPNCTIGANFFIPDSTIEIYDEKGIKGINNAKDTWYVWASVNDMLIRDFKNENNRIAYLGGASGDKLIRKQRIWASLASEKYNRLWFDDNFGNFVISTKILKPSLFFDFC